MCLIRNVIVKYFNREGCKIWTSISVSGSACYGWKIVFIWLLWKHVKASIKKKFCIKYQHSPIWHAQSAVAKMLLDPGTEKTLRNILSQATHFMSQVTAWMRPDNTSSELHVCRMTRYTVHFLCCLRAFIYPFSEYIHIKNLKKLIPMHVMPTWASRIDKRLDNPSVRLWHL